MSSSVCSTTTTTTTATATATATTTKSSPALNLYSDWHFCSGCGLPPKIVTGNTEGLASTDASVKQQQPQQQQQQQQQQHKSRKKLSICRRCKTAAYHNAECQKIHWKHGGHRNDCKKLAQAIQPLLEMVAVSEKQQQQQQLASNDSRRHWRRWWARLDPQDAMDGNRLWKESAVRWNHRGEYLEAMEGFQRALEPVGKLWEDLTTAIANSDKSGELRDENDGDCDENPGRLTLSSLSFQCDDDRDESSFSLDVQLAEKLLFCAYCEVDGNQIRSSRLRLVQCISILLEQSNPSLVPLLGEESEELEQHEQERRRRRQRQRQRRRQSTISPLLNDAWMELMLSYEEEKSAQVRKIARHVAHMAIRSGANPGSLYRCEWKHPLQRPGHMAALGTTHDGSTNTEPLSPLLRPFIPPKAHPSWCKTLEAQWETIARELHALATGSPNPKQRWAAVGSGERGSGGDDHRVVSAGGRWTEYILFGTGAFGNGYNDDNDAPFTKRLLRDCIPDAISLAESGGGEVIFSKLAPRTRIEAHCGPTNLRLTAHLGLVIPAKEAGECKIRVENEWHRWETGKVLLFDDSYEHEIRNDTDHVRIVLLVRLWHPLLSHERRQDELLEARRRKEQSVEKRYHPPE